MIQIKSPRFKLYLSAFIIIMAVLTISLISKLFNPNKATVTSTDQQKTDEPVFDLKSSSEIRAVWMSRFDYSKDLETFSPDVMQAFISTTFQRMAEANFNTVFFQIRGNADAYYKSKYEPWGELLTDTLGKDPGWDPLQFALDQADKYGLNLHAWINVFPAWRGEHKPDSTKPLHPLLKHPEWLVHDYQGDPMELNSHYVSFSPGNPEFHGYLIKIIRDVVNNYDVDGIHFDYIRYPEGGRYSKDPVSLARFQSEKSNPLKLSWEDWQREQVTAFVSKAYNMLTNEAPQVILSAAVIGSYRNWKWNGYKRVYQDAKRWLELGKMDMIVPMLYVGRKGDGSGFRSMLQEWITNREIQGKIIAGIGDFKITWEEVLKEIDDYRNLGFDGCCFFSASSLTPEDYQSLKNTKFKYPAKTPLFPWKKHTPSLPPENLTLAKNGNNYLLEWTVSGKDPGYFANYIIYQSKTRAIDPDSPASIIEILPAHCREFKIPDYNSESYYYISSINSLGIESPLIILPKKPGLSKK